LNSRFQLQWNSRFLPEWCGTEKSKMQTQSFTVKIISVLMLSIILISCGENSSNSKVDDFLNEYEKAVKIWEKKAGSKSFTMNDINEMNKSNMDLMAKSSQLQGTEQWSSEQLKRYSDITTRFSNAMMKMSLNN